MARKIILKVDTTLNQLSVLDYDDVTNVPNGGGVGGFGVWRANPVGTTNLSDLSSKISMVNIFGDTIGNFAHAEIGLMEINGDDVSASCTNLDEVLAVFGPYFFKDDLSTSIEAIVASLSSISASSSGVIVNASGSVTGSGELGSYTVGGATAISVQFSITGATPAATNSVQIHGTIDGTNYTMIGSPYSGTGNFTTTLNYSLISDTTVPYKVKVVVVDGGAGTMETAISILAVRG